MVVNQHPPLEHLDQGLQLEIPRRIGVAGPALAILDGALPLLPYTRLGFSPQAIFRPQGAPGNFIAW